VIVVCGAILAGAALGLLAAGGGAQTVSPASRDIVEAGTDLQELEANLHGAHYSDSLAGVRLHAKRAMRSKADFLDHAFDHDRILGCPPGEAGHVIVELDAIDAAAERAAVDAGGPKLGLRLLKQSAKDFEGFARGTCATSAAQQAAISAVTKLANGIKSAKKPPGAKTRKKLHALKAKVLSGTTVQGCDAVELFDLSESVDTPLAVITEASFEDGGARKQIRRLLEDAIKGAGELFNFWTALPCDGGISTTTTTTSTGTDSTSTTTTTAPAKPECSDGVDDDGDGMVDGADSGCLSMPDTTERSEVWPFHYPGDGASGFDWIDLKPYFGTWIGTVVAYRVLFGTTPVHSSMIIDHGPTPINGTKPCASLGATGIEAGRGSGAPTGGGLPAAPDDNHVRIVIDTSDPPGGGDCGLGPVNLEVAFDTRVP
jgi:hypothetical protein